MADLYIGLISGTSADGVDAALVRFSPQPTLLQARNLPYPEWLRQAVLAVDHGTSLGRIGELDVALGRHFASAVQALLADAGTHPAEVSAIGSHGQTVWHAPEGDTPYTVQLGDPNIIVEATAITTVADFRRRDIAAGGQGAPLVPAFHQGVFSAADEDRWVLNLGGIANLTYLPRAGEAAGFDTGPASTLMDAWIRHHRNQAMDAGGGWARSGHVDPELLNALLSDGYFARTGPRSTGREYFNLAWLERHLNGNELAEDVQATLLELTARSVADAARAHSATATRMLVCGGGVHNTALLERLKDLLGPMRVGSTAELGVDPNYVEATAFAWLAAQTLAQRPGNLPSATGARHPAVLGGVYFR